MGDTRQNIGRYEITRELGHGAQGVVYAAIDPVIGRQVAIKTIRLDTLEGERPRAELTQRIFREAQSAGKLNHPGIITIYDVGEIEKDAYIVMEFVAGRTLEEVMASGIPQHSETLLSVLRQAAAALDYAHSKGIIHRDIKPSNIMICDGGTVKISDFGIAKITASNALTQTGLILGTPNYMSPEQAQGRPIDGSSDQFSLAVVAFQMLSGKLPFEGATLTALLTKILWEEPEYDNSGLREPLRSTFTRALSKNPKLRFPTCADFVKAVEDGYGEFKEEFQERIATSAVRDAETVVDGAVQAAGMPVESNKHAAETLVEPVLAPLPVAPPPQDQEKQATGEESQTVYESPAETKKGKPVLVRWAVILGLVVIAVAAFVALEVSKKKAAPEVSVSLPKPAVSQSKPVQQDQAPTAAPAVKPKTQAQPPLVQKRIPIESKQAKPSISNPQERPAAPVAPIPAKAPITGTITWSGKLGKNSILVISGQKASIGTIQGDFFPGKPVIVEMDPKEIVIRQLPGEANGWEQIMLYSGKSKYSSIRIRWEITQ